MTHSILNSRQSLGIALAVILLGVSLSSGCSNKGALGDVSGVVTLDGAPLPQAIIFFKPDGEGPTAFGRTDDNGYYQLNYVGNRHGTQPGANTVRITTRQEAENAAGRIVWTREQVPAKYNEESTLHVEVEPGKSTLDFELTSK